MAVPPIPPPLAQLGRRPFSFYPAILNAGHNEWVYRSATWSDVSVRNTKTNDEFSVPRRYLGDISRVDAPVMIVGLLAELEYRAGLVSPAQCRVIEMPLAVNDLPRARMAPSPAVRAPVVGIRLESARTSRVGKVVVGGVAIGVAGCVLAISLFRGGIITTRAFYAPVVRVDLPLTQEDDYGAVVRALGQPAAERWGQRIPTPGVSAAQVVCHFDGAGPRRCAIHRSDGLELASRAYGAILWGAAPALRCSGACLAVCGKTRFLTVAAR